MTQPTATPQYPAHDRQRKEEDEEEDDPVISMINKTGCLKLHYAVQECMAEKQDWRQCQKEVSEFRGCMVQAMKEKGPKSFQKT